MAADLSCALAANGFLVRVGAGVQQVTGRSAETLASRPVVEFVHEGDRGTFEAALAWDDAEGEPLVFEARFRHADGTYRWFEWTVAGRTGDEVRRASVRDVTRWKRDEALAVAHARALEAIVAEQPLSDVLAQLAGLLDALAMDCHLAVHLTSPDGQALELLWSPTIPESFARALERLAVPGGPGAAVLAAQERQLVASPDLSLETQWHGRRELPLAHGLRAEWAQPVVDAAGALRGTVTVFLTQPAFPAPRDRQVLALAAQLLVTTLDRGTARDAARAEHARLAEQLTGAERARQAAEARLAEATAAREAVEQAHGSTVSALEQRLAESTAALGDAAASHAAAVRELEGRLDTSADALLRLRAELAQAEERATQAQGEARNAEQARLALASTLDAVRRHAGEEAAARLEAELRVSELERQVAELERAGHEARGAAAQAAARQDAALQEALARQGEAETARRAAELALEGAHAMLEAVRAELAIAERARDEHAAAATSVQEAAARRAWADAEVAMLSLRVTELDGTRGALEQAAHEAREAAEAAATERDALHAALEAARTEADDARARLAAAERRLGELEGTAHDARLAVEELSTLRAQVTMLERQRDALQDALRELQERPPASPLGADVDEDLAAVHAQLAEAEGMRQRLEAELTELRLALEDAHRQLDRERARCSEESDRLVQRLAEAEAARAALAAATPPRPAPRAAWRAEEAAEPATASGEGEALDLSALVERLRGELSAMLPGEVQLHVRLTPHLPPIAGQPAALRQVLAQLVSNAAEALEGRRGVISVGTGVVDADRPYLKSAYFDDGLPEGRYAFLEVSDTGHGMAPEVQRRLFDAGFSTRAPGRGHGLAQTLALVRAHRGAIQVYTKPSIGTTIRVLLPATTVGAARRGEPAAADAPDGDGAVLVVDRDAAMRAAASRILERWGFTVLEAGDVAEGADVLRSTAPVRLVVLEANLHGPDGPATRALRALRGDVRVLLAGEPNGSGNREGASAVVARPFAPVELVAAVRQALGGRDS